MHFTVVQEDIPRTLHMSSPKRIDDVLLKSTRALLWEDNSKGNEHT